MRSVLTCQKFFSISVLSTLHWVDKSEMLRVTYIDIHHVSCIIMYCTDQNNKKVTEKFVLTH